MACRPISIAPSLLTANLARIGEEVATLEASGADRIHWDVMDGSFVPNLTFGPDVIAASRPFCSLPFEAHLMVADPDRLLPRWVEAGCSTVIVHAESCVHLHRTLTSIAELGAGVGVALNPASSAEEVVHVLDIVSTVLVMTVNPGFGGQNYLGSMERKIREIRRLSGEAGREVEVEVDGGISAETIHGAWRAGANSFVSGSALYLHPSGHKFAIDELRRRCSEEVTSVA